MLRKSQLFGHAGIMAAKFIRREGEVNVIDAVAVERMYSKYFDSWEDRNLMVHMLSCAQLDLIEDGELAFGLTLRGSG